MAGAFELYWQSAIGRALMETLGEMVLSPDLAISVQVQFDEFMSTGQPAQEQGLLQGTMLILQRSRLHETSEGYTLGRRRDEELTR